MTSLSLLMLFFQFNQSDFSANGFQIYEKKEYWRAFTTTLLHGDLNHLAHNAFFFAGLGALLSNYFGFWVFPFFSFIVGGIINLLALAYYDPRVTLVGVSGVIYFMAAFWLILYMLIEKRQKPTIRFLHASGVTLIFLFPQVFQPEVSYLAHGLGFLLGLPTGVIYYFLNKKSIKAQEVWTEIVKDDTEDFTQDFPSSSHLERPEASSPSQHASDSSQFQSH